MTDRLIWLTALAVLGTQGCGDGATEPSGLPAGNYVATVFRATIPGVPPVDILAAGGELSVTIRNDGGTTGSLRIPPDLTGTEFTASMEGRASLSGNTVRFEQGADTFVRDLVWTLDGSRLFVLDQMVGGVSFTVTLTRQ